MNVKKVAKISRLNLTEEEEESFKKEFDDILEWFGFIDEINTEGVEPSFHPIEIRDRTREDEVEDTLEQKEALENTDHKEGGYFKGPRVV